MKITGFLKAKILNTAFRLVSQGCKMCNFCSIEKFLCSRTILSKWDKRMQEDSKILYPQKFQENGGTNGNRHY